MSRPDAVRLPADRSPAPPLHVEPADPEEAPTRRPAGWWARVMSARAVLVAAWMLCTLGFGAWANLRNRAMLLAVAFVLTCGVYPLRKGFGLLLAVRVKQPYWQTVPVMA